jgi:hypothetical protein
MTAATNTAPTRTGPSTTTRNAVVSRERSDTEAPSSSLPKKTT